MYPLVQIGPLGLSSGGLLLVAGIVLGSWVLGRSAAERGGALLAARAEGYFYAALLGAVLGGRLWYGVLNWDLYRRAPMLLLALRLEALAWPGALLGGLAVAELWSRRKGQSSAPAADLAALALPATQALASVGLLLSGEAYGRPTALPWGIELLGAARHPTQLLFAAAALVSFGLLRRLSAYTLPAGTLLAAYLALNGLAMLLLEPLRADSPVLIGGARLNQVVGLLLLLAVGGWARGRFASPADPAGAAPAERSGT